MKKSILFLLLLLSITAIARPKVKYKTYSALKIEFEERARVQLYDSIKYKQELSALPIGGNLTIEITGLTLESANPKNWEYIITYEDQQIFREPGRNKIPNAKYHQGTTYWNGFDMIFLRQKVDSPFTLSLVDKISNKRYDYMVDPVTGKIENLK